jgi:hypothetical protein
MRIGCRDPGVEMSSHRRFTTPAQPLSHTIVARTEGYTYHAEVCALCLVSRAVLCRPRAKPYSSESHQTNPCLPADTHPSLRLCAAG